MAEIIVALDNILANEALQLAYKLRSLVWGFKVNDLLVREGCSIITRLKQYGNVMADGKYHDIQTTVENCVAAVDDAGADLVTVWDGSGGRERLAAAVKAARRTKVVGISVLTSSEVSASDQNALQLSMALVRKVGAHGMVCPARCLATIAAPDVITIVPGIRLPNDAGNEHAQPTSPAEVAKLATYLVVGRSVTASDEDPVIKVKKLLEAMNG